MLVTEHLVQPTREQCGPHQRSPIWSCSGWGLPCHACYQPCGALLPHHFTLTLRLQGGVFSVALSVGSRPPGVTWHPVLRSPDFPPRMDKYTHSERLPGQLPLTIYQITPAGVRLCAMHTIPDPGLSLVVQQTVYADSDLTPAHHTTHGAIQEMPARKKWKHVAST